MPKEILNYGRKNTQLDHTSYIYEILFTKTFYFVATLYLLQTQNDHSCKIQTSVTVPYNLAKF